MELHVWSNPAHQELRDNEALLLSNLRSDDPALYRIPVSPEAHQALARRVEAAQRAKHWTPRPEPGLLAGIRRNPASRRWGKRVFGAVGLFAAVQYHALWLPYLLWTWAGVAVVLVLWIAVFALLCRSVWFLHPEEKP